MSQSKVTFAEAYRNQKLLRRPVVKSRINETHLDYSAGHLNSVMLKMVQWIVDDLPLEIFERTIIQISRDFGARVESWHDENRLNLLHHAIINKRAHLLNFFLTFRRLYPERHVAPSNPYAHLAAHLGSTDCLGVILQNRPADYFRCSKPIHEIDLPEHVLNSVKHSNKPNKSIRKKSSIRKELHVPKRFERESTKTFHTSDGPENAPIKSLPEITAVNSQTKSRPIRSKAILSRNSIDSNVSTFTQSNSQGNTLPKHDGIPAAINEHLQPRTKPRSGRHIITIHQPKQKMEELSFGQGVVNGAGDSIYTRYRPILEYWEQGVNYNNNSRHSSEGPAINMKIPQIHEYNRSKLYQQSKTKMKPGAHVSPASNTNSSNVNQNEIRPRNRSVSQLTLKETIAGKTPLTLAAERDHVDCVNLIFQEVYLKRYPDLSLKTPLTIATKARDPAAILMILKWNFSRPDLQHAILLSIEEMQPQCLSALLSKNSTAHVPSCFGGINLFHILYSHCLANDNLYELMPEMTSVLIECNQRCNDTSKLGYVYPLYTLIECIFKSTIDSDKKTTYFLECLVLLLKHGANPTFYELKLVVKNWNREFFTRLNFFPNVDRIGFRSALHCIFHNAIVTHKYHEHHGSPKLLARKLVSLLEMHDITRRRKSEMAVFEYMDGVCDFGLDRSTVLCLLRYGANPDYAMPDGSFVINLYFDKILAHVSMYEIENAIEHYRLELDVLMIICRHMRPSRMHAAHSYFLEEHLLSAPMQALSVVRQFALMADQLMRNPRSLLDTVAKKIWSLIGRRKSNLARLPIAEGYFVQILPH